MSWPKRPPASGAAGNVPLILAIVLLQALILFLVVAIIYLLGGIRGEDSAPPDSSWTAWP